MGIEPTPSAWEADVLPLNYTRLSSKNGAAEGNRTLITRLATLRSTTELQPHGAGEGNRTLVTSLEGWSFTIKLHPLIP